MAPADCDTERQRCQQEDAQASPYPFPGDVDSLVEIGRQSYVTGGRVVFAHGHDYSALCGVFHSGDVAGPIHESVARLGNSSESDVVGGVIMPLFGSSTVRKRAKRCLCDLSALDWPTDDRQRHAFSSRRGVGGKCEQCREDHYRCQDGAHQDQADASGGWHFLSYLRLCEPHADIYITLGTTSVNRRDGLMV